MSAWNIKAGDTREALSRLGAPELVPVIGKLYDVKHERKGNFRLQVTNVRDEWLDGIIVTGRARYVVNEDRMEGDPITVRNTLVELTPVPVDE